MAFCLSDRFLSYLGAMGYTTGILKSACKWFLSRAVSSIPTFGVGGTSGSAGVLPEY